MRFVLVLLPSFSLPQSYCRILSTESFLIMSVFVGGKPQAYKNQSYKLLQRDFPRLSAACISSVFAEKEYEFSDAFRCLKQINTLNEEDVCEQFEFLLRVSKIRLKKSRRVLRSVTVTDPTLRAELAEISEFNQKENRQPEIINLVSSDEEDEVEKKKAPEATKVDCECCFGDYEFAEMVQCTEGRHLFCPGCLQHHVEEQVFTKNSTEFPCMHSGGDPCVGVFDRRQLGNLPKKLQEQVDERIARAEMENAGKVW